MSIFIKSFFALLYVLGVLYLSLDLDSFDLSYQTDMFKWCKFVLFFMVFSVLLYIPMTNPFIVCFLIGLELLFVSNFYKTNYYHHPNKYLSAELVHRIFKNNTNTIMWQEDIKNTYSKTHLDDLASSSFYIKNQENAKIFFKSLRHRDLLFYNQQISIYKHSRDIDHKLYVQRLKNDLEMEKEIIKEREKKELNPMQVAILKKMPKKYIKEFIELEGRAVIDTRLFAYE